MQEQLQEQLYDIYSLWHVPLWQKPWFWPVIIISTVCIVGGLGSWLIYRWYKNRPRSLWERAHRAMNELSKIAADGRISHTIWYSKVTQVLRPYVIGRFGLRQKGLTDHEMVHRLESLELSDQMITPLKEVIERAVICKFHPALSLEEQQRERDAACVLTFIEQTKPAEKARS